MKQVLISSSDEVQANSSALEILYYGGKSVGPVANIAVNPSCCSSHKLNNVILYQSSMYKCVYLETGIIF
jgi:hypothetical protein